LCFPPFSCPTPRAGTNWNSVRFKPPPAHSDIGWRVEFRTMEVQITDFENAALTIFVALLSRAVLHFSLNFYMKISAVDENMARASARGAALEQKFLFRCMMQFNDFPSLFEFHFYFLR
jgi:glutamate--cysteine ligase catalytic subunit